MDKQLKVAGIPSSFVFSNMKLEHDAGAGEAKLFVGSKKNEKTYDAFFEFGLGYKFKFCKDNILSYLEQTKMEYVFQCINQYKEASIATWNENVSIIKSMANDDFNINLFKFTDSSRYYVRADENIFKKQIRKIIVPKITDIIFQKDMSSKEITLYLCVNYEFNNGSNDNDEKITEYSTGYESKFSRNRIVFGAPGTGKSYALNKECKELLGSDWKTNYERVTFHPDYSYANFVGTYKPTMIRKEGNTLSNLDKKDVLSILHDKSKSAQEKYDLLYDKFKDDGLTRLPLLIGLYSDDNFKTKKLDGSDAVGDNSVERNHGRAIRPYVNLVTDITPTKEISYEYVPGPFMRILVKSLKSAMTNSPKPYLLIVEEINRANVAAVFGDVFQLLDRDSNYVSEYSISTTNDMRSYLAQELDVDESLVETIKIPDNMFIWATMNSADQGVFPMDTAFKRRWDFSYLGIDDAVEEMSDTIKNKKYTLGTEANTRLVKWNDLRSAINDVLSSESYNINEDKLLGPYFISKSILESEDEKEFIKVFKNKVLMYLFDDAAKQKKKTFFEKCKDEVKGVRYSDLCNQFDTKGVFIFPEEVSKRFTEKPKTEEVAEANEE